MIMALNSARGKYTATIGIECHVQLNTKTKLFAAVSNDARSADPNTLISHICLGMPGALPVLNQKVLEYAVKVAFAFNTRPQRYSFFERKHYFYPDLPKGYQISQLSHPIIKGGHVTINTSYGERNVQINRVQIEEDAGKSIHPQGADYSLVDLNRAGTPLLEIVSEPDMHSSEEAKAYARELWLLMRYSKVSDADMFHGNMRVDVNVSVSKDPNVLGLRTETKNLNSFKNIEKAVDYEIDRQIELLEKGQPIVQETRGWDDAKQKTFSQRSKEDAHDYRYMPDPDIPPVELDDAAVAEAEAAMPVMPGAYREMFTGLGLDVAAIETLINMPEHAQLVGDLKAEGGEEHAKRIANWIVNTTSQQHEEDGVEKPILTIPVRNAIELSEMVAANKLSSTAAKSVWLEMTVKGGQPGEIATRNNLLQVSNEDEISQIVKRVLEENPKAAEDVKNGEVKAIGFLVGQVMKQSQGKANPALTQELIKKQLSI